ncbi:hypothetical protein MPNT_20115 [Candidatus Methylacidithermus pantelleriae]|uniref:Uncharacterized protein n=2 Tax=Candidatus Methylacidithermus pantelleriae TaxID=2744239 RepID=A0A8J2BPC9_9BACT|nr:hypothetical protein MPNT_20115 [Candidatus Methylacidithermus pantelleriae]
MDRFGNRVDVRGMRWNLYGKGEEEAKAVFTDACKRLRRFVRKWGNVLVVVEGWHLCER